MNQEVLKLEIKAGNLHFKVLNEQLKTSSDCDIKITNCLGQRYIGSGVVGKNITIHGACNANRKH